MFCGWSLLLINVLPSSDSCFSLYLYLKTESTIVAILWLTICTLNRSINYNPTTCKYERINSSNLWGLTHVDILLQRTRHRRWWFFWSSVNHFCIWVTMETHWFSFVVIYCMVSSWEIVIFPLIILLRSSSLPFWGRWKYCFYVMSLCLPPLPLFIYRYYCQILKSSLVNLSKPRTGEGEIRFCFLAHGFSDFSFGLLFFTTKLGIHSWQHWQATPQPIIDSSWPKPSNKKW